MVIAVCGQAVSQTPQATQTSTSLEATWAGVIAKPVLSMLMARAAAAFAWAMDSGIVLGPWAVPHRNMPVRCVSTGASLGWNSRMKPAAAVCTPATRAMSCVPLEPSRPAESTTRSYCSSLLVPVIVFSMRTVRLPSSSSRISPTRPRT